MGFYYNKVAPCPMGAPKKHLRSCIVCGKPISSRAFSQRLPENKLELCTRHMKSYCAIRRQQEKKKVKEEKVANV
jgi:hypothetical protein